jgi:hypothetical protein
MTSGWLRRVAYLGADESFDSRRVKAVAIRSELAQMESGVTYADTSHMFVKTFADVVLNEFSHDSISVIALRRPLIETVRSFAELDEFGLSRLPWHDFLSVATAPCVRFPLRVDEIENQFDLIFAYLVEMVMRSAEIRRSAPAVTWIEADLSTISTMSGAADLLARLGLEAPADLAELVESRPNQKRMEKAAVGPAVSTDLVEARLQHFCSRFWERPGFGLFEQWYDVQRRAR